MSSNLKGYQLQVETLRIIRIHSQVEMLDQIQETQDKPRNIRKLNPYPRQEQVINPKNLGNPGNTQVIYFLGKPKKTQVIPR